MTIIQILLQELENEAATTRKFLSIVPMDKLDWQPHPKSMTLRALATHIAELPSWVTMAVHTEGLDFESNPYEPTVVNNQEELLDYHERNFQQAVKDLKGFTEDQLEKRWTLSSGQHILMDTTRYGTIRVALSQTIHHRAQLGVFLRLLDVPIPGSYGPSADENNF